MYENHKNVYIFLLLLFVDCNIVKSIDWDGSDTGGIGEIHGYHIRKRLWAPPNDTGVLDAARYQFQSIWSDLLEHKDNISSEVIGIVLYGQQHPDANATLHRDERP